MAKSAESLSIPKKEIIHGIEIKKMPCGKYFEAMQTLKDLPEDFMKQLNIDNKNLKLSEMMTIEGISNMIMKLLVILPDFTVNFLSKLMDIDAEKIRNEITPKELLDIIREFWRINELQSFFTQMKPIQNKIMTLIGFKEPSQFVSKSE